MEVANRISFIDQLKGITILLVVIGHLIEHNAGRDNFFVDFYLFFSHAIIYVYQWLFGLRDIQDGTV